MKIVAGSSSSALAGKLASELGCDLCRVEINRFPDGECYVRILEDLEGQKVSIVSNSHPDVNIIELMLLQDAVRESGAALVVTIIPYFGYARQDKVFKAGETVSAFSMVKRIQLGTDSIILADIHEAKILDWFHVPAFNVTASVEMGRILKNRGVDLIVAPDMGAKDIAERVAQSMDAESDFIVKKRLDANNVAMKLNHIKARGRNICIVDDIISTGSTMITAAENLYSRGANKIYAASTHGLFSKENLARLRERLTGIFTSDSLENESTVFSLAPAIAQSVKNNF